MSIKSFTQAAQLLYQQDYYDESLCLVCNAIDACAAQKYPDLAVTNRYKKFLSQHFRTISKIGFPGIDASQIKIKLQCTVESLIPDENGYVDMPQIIYHTIRCGLVHRCTIDRAIIFTDQTIISDWEQDKFLMPRTLIWGLIAAINEELIEAENLSLADTR